MPLNHIWKRVLLPIRHNIP